MFYHQAPVCCHGSYRGRRTATSEGAGPVSSSPTAGAGSAKGFSLMSSKMWIAGARVQQFLHYSDH